MKAIDKENYTISETDDIYTPAAAFYPELIRYNTDLVIRECGGPEHIWAHVKTFKCADVLKILQEKGIRRFKCATIGEAEMAAQCGAEKILLAYPLVGPNIRRFLDLADAYPKSEFWAIGDNAGALTELGSLAAGRDRTVPVLLDVNIGMNRTGVALESAAASYAAFDRIPGIELLGLHCFSGDFKITDLDDRQKAVDRTASWIADIRTQITTAGYTCKVLVLSGTAVLKNYGIFPDAYLCPGTAFISDLQYHRIFPDYDYIPAAALLTRVISTPLPGQFTLDLGYKAIAADPKGTRGMILGYEDAEVCFQCEEHWTWHTDREDAPKVGDLLYVLPTHICPSITCYPRVLVVENHSVTGTWTVTARDRMLSV